MANKKKIEEREKVLKARQSQRTIQTVGGILLGVIVIVILWLVFSNPEQPAEETPLAIPTDIVPAAPAGRYSAPPPMTIDVTKQYFATFKMANGGEFKVELFADKTPITVNNFVFLAREGFYDGTTFHRVLDGFMAQGGDPEGTGSGGPGYNFQDEFTEDLVFDRGGLLAMANSGPNTNGSQFFITYAETPWLNGQHTIFGEVVEGMDVVNGLTRRDPNEGPSFTGDVIATIEITEQ